MTRRTISIYLKYFDNCFFGCLLFCKAFPVSQNGVEIDLVSLYMLPLSSVRGIKMKKSQRGRDLENFTTILRDPSLHLKICYAVISHVIWELLST